jgi:hypothetical protein
MPFPARDTHTAHDVKFYQAVCHITHCSTTHRVEAVCAHKAIVGQAPRVWWVRHGKVQQVNRLRLACLLAHIPAGCDKESNMCYNNVRSYAVEVGGPQQVQQYAAKNCTTSVHMQVIAVVPIFAAESAELPLCLL